MTYDVFRTYYRYQMYTSFMFLTILNSVRTNCVEGWLHGYAAFIAAKPTEKQQDNFSAALAPSRHFRESNYTHQSIVLDCLLHDYRILVCGVECSGNISQHVKTI